MKINHIALYVKDLECVKNFFIHYFGATANNLYHNPRTGLKTYFLTFENETQLEIMTKPDLTESPKNLLQTGYIHLAFSAGGKEKVDELTATLRENGYQVISGPRTTGDGCYESCILGPENNQIEITE